MERGSPGLSMTRATPKSHSLSRPFLSSIRFSGLISLWITRALWHALTAEGTSGASPPAPERVDLASLPQPWADGRSILQIYLASGKLKHARDFWLLPSTQQVSWGKTLRAKKCKTERLASVVAEPKIRHAKELFEEMDDDQSGYLDDKE